MSTSNKGSEWRRWDLHLHTASSYDYKYKGNDANKLLVKALRSNNIKAVAITDHFIIDKDRVENLRSLAPEIVFFPGVELRTDKGDTNIHPILIFDPEFDLTVLSDKFNVFKLDKGVDPESNERVYWDYKDILEFAKKNNAIITIHAGGKTNGVDDRISNKLPHNQAVKKEYAENVDIFEMNNPSDFDGYRNFVFPDIGLTRSMIICSDNHDPRDYSPTYKLWIKADTTFAGLKQAVIEHDRIFIGEVPPALDRANKQRTKTIDSITINKESLYHNEYGKWFEDVEMFYNPELTAIIGNKGSGKTAIAEITALLGNTSNRKDFIFLHKDKFYRNKLGSFFSADLKWSNNTMQGRKKLNESVPSNSTELVHFVAQNCFEKFCNDDDKKFSDEVDNVVFSRMPESKKDNFSTFDELLTSKKELINEKKAVITVELKEINEKIKNIESQLDKNYKEKIQNELNQANLEFAELINTEPPIVPQPEELATSSYFACCNEVYNEIEAQIAQNQQKFEILEKKKEKILTFSEKVNSLKEQIENKCESLKQELTENGLDITIDEIFTYQFTLDKLDLKIKKYEENITEVLKLISSNPLSRGELLKELESYKVALEEYSADSRGKVSAYQKYLADSKEWVQRKANLEVKISSLESQIANIGDFTTSPLVSELKGLRNARLEKTNKFFQYLEEEVAIYQTFKAPIKDFLELYKDELKNYLITIESGIFVKNRVINTFENEYISGSVHNPFKKAEEDNSFKTLSEKFDFSQFSGVENFLKELEELFDNVDREKCYHNMFKKDKYDKYIEDFYTLNFIEPRYSLQLHGKELRELSPGERGSLLLIFYLLLDARDIPLILDQPEDNLDNQSIAEILVPFIKRAKEKRQIIIVTHNANLAVVSDAEQIIRVKLNKKDNFFSFESGSLESEIINDVVDVLEGTSRSFDIRAGKYKLR